MKIYPIHGSSWSRLTRAGRFHLVAIMALAAAVAGISTALISASGRSAALATTDPSGTASLAPGTIQAPVRSSGGITVTYPAHVPAGYSYPSGIAADASGGVWYFAESATRDTLFHFNAQTGRTTRYQLPPSLAIRSGLVTPIVTDGTGDVWIGINETLAEVNASTGAVRTVSLPALPLASKQVADPPAPPPGRPETAFEDVQSLAVGTGGRIYIGRLFAAELQSYDPHSGTFATVALPPRSVLEGYGSDLATLPDGDVDAVLWTQPSAGAGAVVLESRGPSGWSAVATGGCTVRTVTQSAGQLLAIGSGCVSGASAQEPAITSHALPLMATGSILGVLGTGAPLSSAEDLVGTADGAELLHGGQATAIPLGTVVLAPPIGGPMRPEGKTTQNRVVPMMLGLVSAKSAGHVWFTSGYGGPQLGLMTVGS
jgi:hypothetical protein